MLDVLFFADEYMSSILSSGHVAHPHSSSNKSWAVLGGKSSKLIHAPSYLLVRKSYCCWYASAWILINSLATSLYWSLCLLVSFSQFICPSSFCKIASQLASHIVFWAAVNSHSLTTEVGSRVFMKVNIADISHTQVWSFNATTSCLNWVLAASKFLTSGLDLNVSSALSILLSCDSEYSQFCPHFKASCHSSAHPCSAAISHIALVSFTHNLHLLASSK